MLPRLCHTHCFPGRHLTRLKASTFRWPASPSHAPAKLKFKLALGLAHKIYNGGIGGTRLVNPPLGGSQASLARHSGHTLAAATTQVAASNAPSPALARPASAHHSLPRPTPSTVAQNSNPSGSSSPPNTTAGPRLPPAVPTLN